ncbi:NAD-dependent epimerase/dehydratase family protein [Halobacterium noricense]|uniref:NAD-dependent epimerase/dehydratase family protein n=1 Tax=Halobacterium noricense TaxID=223182 RepID=UPI001E4818BF|nr:NAD(P)-dependent oxidoreductase [Halobacterium noricense]UHH23930.1 NAD(P)-dependent oxidoreductase [Halobacterium noricense]
MCSASSSVVVTGALGGVGQWVVDRLVADGHDVVGLDQRLPAEGGPEGASFFEVDLTDQGETNELISDADPDAVVHLAAIPDPTNHAGSRVFTNNVESAYNVLDAGGRVGADIVWASSESAYGFPFADSVLKPEYVPIDEAHPFRPEDPYGVSKVSGEAVAKATARRHDVSVVSIRPSWVQYPGGYLTEQNREAFDVDGLAARSTEDPPDGGIGNFWSYIDVRDFASMVTAALDADVSGHEAYLCHADENYLDVDTAALFDALFEDAPPCDTEGNEAAFTTAKAERDLGWTPEHTWRDAADEDADGPDFA